MKLGRKFSDFTEGVVSTDYTKFSRIFTDLRQQTNYQRGLDGLNTSVKIRVICG